MNRPHIEFTGRDESGRRSPVLHPAVLSSIAIGLSAIIVALIIRQRFVPIDVTCRVLDTSSGKIFQGD